MTAAWLVRAGGVGQREETALSQSVAVVGWAELGDLAGAATREDLRARVAAAYPDGVKARIANWTGQLWRFVAALRPGDLVVLPLVTRPDVVAVGRVTGPYRYRAEAPAGARHARPVSWVRTDVPRGAIRPDLLDSMGSLLTVCRLQRNGAARRIAELARSGRDPGPRPDELPEVTGGTAVLARAARSASPVRLTIRELLRGWGAERRTSGVVARIGADLADNGLTTRPAFTEGWLDSTVELVPVGAEPDLAAAPGPADAADAAEPAEVADATDLPPLTLSVGTLVPDDRGVASVRTDQSLTAAMTLMLAQNYSQLAVVDERGTVHGAVSWESIGRARLANSDAGLRAATVPARVVDLHEDVLSQIAEIYARGFVFVRAADRTGLAGIVTAADLTQRFGRMARPFALIEEAERRLRRWVDETLDIELVRAVNRRANSAADLTLGNYEHLLTEPNFRALGWPLDRSTFLAQLTRVRRIRNELMHFSPDPPGEAELNDLEGFVSMLRTVDPRP